MSITHTRTLQGRIQAPAPPKSGKNIIFLRKIVIFHTKYPKHFRAIFLSAPPPPNLKSWIRP